MASVRIEGEAFNDRRYNRLAERAGLADADHARGKMAALWLQCTIERRYILPVRDVEEVLGAHGVDALEYADLGERVDDGVRIRGTRGRIEWLEKLRKNGKYGKLGGRPKKATRVTGNETTRVPKNAVSKTPLAPAPALAPSPSGIPDSLHARESWHPKRDELRNRGWKRLNEMRKQVGGDSAKDLHPFDPGQGELAERLAECGEDRAASDLDHVLSMLLEEAQAKKSVEHLTGASFQPKPWRRLLGMQPGDARRAVKAAGGRPTEPTIEVRDITRRLS